jgi:hypothetical protein
MKKFLVVCAAVLLMLGLAGRAKAAFTCGDIIEVVYQPGSGYEVATDIGSASSIIANGQNALQNSSFQVFGSGSSFTGADPTTLKVAYFSTTSTEAGIWVSGTYGGTETNVGYQTGETVTGENMYNLINSVYGGATGPTNAWVNFEAKSPALTPSYYGYMNKNGTAIGSFDGFIASGSGDGEAQLVSGGAGVNQSIFYWATDTTESTQNGQSSANFLGLNTYYNPTNETLTTSVIAPQRPTPIPPSVLLFGSGLLGLILIGRKSWQ